VNSKGIASDADDPGVRYRRLLAELSIWEVEAAAKGFEPLKGSGLSETCTEASSHGILKASRRLREVFDFNGDGLFEVSCHFAIGSIKGWGRDG
jgi:hypothetical protein